MKEYNKTFEDVYSSDSPSNKKKLCLEKISIEGMGLNEYTLFFKKFLTDFYLDLFNYCVKLSWLRRIFSYNNKRIFYPASRVGPSTTIPFSKFLKRNIGKEIKMITRSRFFPMLESYFNDFFPGFDEGNPFENPEYYKFPFENISIDFLIVVYQLDNRMMLLKKADEEKMSYAVFADYVINHVLSINNELGRDRYLLKQDGGINVVFYIKDTDKKRKN